MTLPADGIVRYRVTVAEDWLDYNDHMNVAMYLRAFDDASEALSRIVGMGPDYERETGNSWVALESHITYQREARLGEVLDIETRVLGVTAKKLHLCQEMLRNGELLATHEQLGLHFDTGARASSPFAPDILANYTYLYEAQGGRPRPEWLGRAVALEQSRPRA